MLIRLRRKTKAQSTAEYAILLSLVVAAALGMQHEIRRAIQAKMKDAIIMLANTSGGGVGSAQQYEPQAGNRHREQESKQTTEEIEVTAEEQPGFWYRDSTSTTTFNSSITQ